MRNALLFFAAMIGVFGLPVVSVAQISSDQIPQGRVVPLKESVEAQMADSRWKWGPLRIEPDLKLTNVGYDANVFGTGSEETDDFRATVGLGVRTIMPLGPKIFLRVDAVPEYTWYYELENRRRGGWEAGGAFLGLFNRMQIEIAGSTNRTVDGVNSEELTPTGQQIDRVYGNLEIDIFKRVSVFVGAEARSTSYDPFEGDEALNLNLLDRDETLQRLGLRYKFRPDVSVYAMVEQTDAEFPNDPVFSSNDGEAILGGFSYDRERFYLNVLAGQRTIDYEGEGAPKFDDLTGSGFLALRLMGRSELKLSLHATPVYTTFVENPYFYETRTGAQVGVPMGDRLVLLGGYETGSNEYQQPIELPDGGVVVRNDDVNTWNLGLGFQLKGGVGLEVRYSVDSYDSNIDSYSRDVARVLVSLRTSILTLTAR